MSLLERLALKSLKDKKVQMWLTMLIEVDGTNTPKVLKSYTKVATTSAVKKVLKPKKKIEKKVPKVVEKKFSKVNEGGDLF